MLFCCLLIFFQNQLFQKIISGIPSECQSVGLIWFKTAYKSYLEKTVGDKELIESSHEFVYLSV